MCVVPCDLDAQVVFVVLCFPSCVAMVLHTLRALVLKHAKSNNPMTFIGLCVRVTLLSNNHGIHESCACVQQLCLTDVNAFVFMFVSTQLPNKQTQSERMVTRMLCPVVSFQVVGGWEIPSLLVNQFFDA